VLPSFQIAATYLKSKTNLLNTEDFFRSYSNVIQSGAFNSEIKVGEVQLRVVMQS